jgi:hypothetical protein
MSDKTNITFKEFQKSLKGIDYKVMGDWDIMLPFNTSRETIQKIIDASRENLVVDWHIKYSEITEEVTEPKVNFYWDRRKS